MSNIDPEIEKWLDDAIKQVLTPHGLGSAFLHKNRWNYEHLFDFNYGQKSGLILGLVFGYYIKKFGKEPNDPEMADIVSMIESHIDEIKESCEKE